MVPVLVVGMPNEWRTKPDWRRSPGFLLERAGGTYLGSVTCGDEKSQVEYTMLISPQSDILLFASNIDNGGGFANEEDICRHYETAKQVWDNAYSTIPMPHIDDCRYHWQGWVTNNL